MSCRYLREKAFQAEETANAKPLETEACLACLRNSKKVNTAIFLGEKKRLNLLCILSAVESFSSDFDSVS